MKMLFRCAAALTLAASGAAAADAQTYRYDYAATGSAGTLGSFTVSQNGTDYSLLAFSGTVGGVSYSLADVGLFQWNSSFNIGGLSDASYRVDPNTDDFLFLDDIVPGSASSTNTLVYGVAVNPGIQYADVTVTATAITPAVPEPATWAMMIVGFGLVGAASRNWCRSTAATLA